MNAGTRQRKRQEGKAERELGCESTTAAFHSAADLTATITHPGPTARGGEGPE